MHRLTTNPVLIRFTVWLTALVVAFLALLLLGGGLDQLLEYVNDLF
jgi:hypothetical protein